MTIQETSLIYVFFSMRPVRGSESFRLFTRKCQLIGQSLTKTQGISNGKLVQANKRTFNMAGEVKSNIAW